MEGAGSTVELIGLDLESRQMVLDMIDQLKDRLLTREKILEYDKNEIFPESIIREMLGPDIGLQLLFIPEEYGGMGGGARDCCAVTRKMSNICLGIATAFFAIQLGCDPLLVGGTDAQKKKWLGKLIETDTLVAYGVTEPGAGSNVAGISTKADPVTNDSGKITGYIINGAKQFISNGGAADFVSILAKAPEGPTFFVVEKGMEGFSPGKSEEKHGIRASNTSALSLTDVFVPIENLIGGIPGNGLKQANKVFGYTRLMVAAMALGAGEAALDIAVSYAQERIQFGGPLSEKQGYTHKLIVPHFVRLNAATYYIDELAHRLDADEEDLQVEGAIAKLFASESASAAARDAMQALGGYGYINEFMVEKIQRDVRITCIYEGTSEILQSIISTFRWKKTRKTKGEYFDSFRAEMEASESEVSGIGCHYYALAANAVNKTIDFVHKHKLTRQQYIMFALADMITHVEIGVSMAKKAKSTPESGDNIPKNVIQCMSRAFAAEVCRVVSDNIVKIVIGSGVVYEEASNAFLKESALNEMQSGSMNLLADLDRIADYIFQRN